MVEQLNKIQIRAEILTIIAKLELLTDATKVDEILMLIEAQNDKKTILDVLMRELVKTNEQKSFIICFLLLRLCEKEHLENALWNTLKSPIVSDYNKMLVLNLLKDMGNRVDYEQLGEYFESPDEVVDVDTKELLNTAIMNPEAQIDLLDFLEALPYDDKITLVKSLGDDYSDDALANILIPIFMHDPTSKIARIALDILGKTKSQLALHALNSALEFVEEDIIPEVKRSISALKISGVREENVYEFYKQVLSETRPYEAYTSYPDGHGNQALIFSRERISDNTLQIVATVINDKWGVVDCFGFNQITKEEFERIVERFYGVDEHVYINQAILKSLITNAENIVRRNGEIMSYEYICWSSLFSDIPLEPVPMEMILGDKFNKEPLSDKDFDKICLSDIAQKWFYDKDFSEEFATFVEKIDAEYKNENYDVDLDKIIDDDYITMFNKKEEKLWRNRILTSAYLKYLANEKLETQRLYSLYFDEEAQTKMMKNILRKSIYEYYVALKFKLQENNQAVNIFARNRKNIVIGFTMEQLDKIIAKIESRWVEG